MKNVTAALGIPALFAVASAASAGSIDLKFTNNSGFLATPVYTGFHDGSFDAFEEGAAASAGIELVAELPIPPFVGQEVNGTTITNTLAAERLAAAPNSQGGFIFGPNGPVADGEVGRATFNIADPATNRYASFFAMFVPSNDTFIGNDDPLAYAIFDMAGEIIEQTIEITAGSIWDAGTEVNQLFGAAAPGQEITLGDDEGGVIRQLLDITGSSGGDGFDDLETLFGVAGAGDITADTVLFTIDVSATPVPVPASALLLMGSVGGAAVWARRQKKKAFA